METRQPLDRTDGHSSIDDARVTIQLWLYRTTGQIPQLGRGGILADCGDRLSVSFSLGAHIEHNR